MNWLIGSSSDGNLWVAVYGTNRVMVFSPDGSHLKDIVFPAKCLTCTTWGGKDHNIIYLTSGMDQSADRKADDEGGCMFMFKTDAKGKVKHEFAG